MPTEECVWFDLNTCQSKLYSKGLHLIALISAQTKKNTYKRACVIYDPVFKVIKIIKILIYHEEEKTTFSEFTQGWKILVVHHFFLKASMVPEDDS